MMIDTTRIDSELEKMKKQVTVAEEFRNKAVDAANRYIERIMPILKKRGIKIASSQIYFNPSIINPEYANRALAHLEYTGVYGAYDSIKVKHLEKELRDAGIPMPISNVNCSITLTLYDETLNREPKV